MPDGNNQLRAGLERTFQPPVDVLLDPSLLVARRSLERLAESAVFDAQTQATLGQVPTEPRLGDIFVPAAFRDLLATDSQSTVQASTVWDFYRGQAEAAFPQNIVDLLDRHDVNAFAGGSDTSGLSLGSVVDDTERHHQLQEMLEDELGFLQSGGFVLSRTTTALEALRDAGVPTVDVGNAALQPDAREILTDVGFEQPAPVCAFAVGAADATVDAITSSIFEEHADLLLYRVGN